MEYLKQPIGNPDQQSAEVVETVTRIIRDIRSEGMEAVRRYSREYDNWDPPSFRVGEQAVDEAGDAVGDALRLAFSFLSEQVERFSRHQLDSQAEFEIETLPGIFLGQKQIPVQAVGAYLPGGRYPLIATAVMTVATAKTAGVPRVVAAAPPWEGRGIYPPQLWALAESGADEIYCIGGVQAMAGMAFGLEGSAPVDMLVGPGNAYVAEAKRQLYGTVGIDLPAGPTEITIIADDSADPAVVACDLLAQAEHGPTSPAVLITINQDVGHQTIRDVDWWLERWPTADVAGAAWRDYGSVILCDDDEEVISIANKTAPEHLVLFVADPDKFVNQLHSYGTLFIGSHATVAFSDKAIGTNHTLPTKRAARFTGGLSVASFLKTVTTVRCDGPGSYQVAGHSAVLADAEGMAGHAISSRLRLNPEFFEGS